MADSGIEVVIANDGLEVLNILKQDSNFLLILMDAHMPNMDGFEATQEIRKNPDYDHILIVALSGDTAADDIKKMHSAGMSEHLEKPLKIDSLYDIIYAYSGGESAKNTATEEFPVATSLNIKEGLEVCGGDDAFYNEILQEFEQSYKNAPQKLKQLLETQEFQAADQLLLDILGVSANIGANQLKEDTANLKNSLKEKDTAKLSKYFTDFTQEMSHLLEDIHSYLKNS